MIILEGKIGIILERKTIVHMSLSSYYSNLYITLQINIFNFLPPFWLWITKNKILPFSLLRKDYTRSFSLPRWQQNFRDLSLGYTSHS